MQEGDLVAPSRISKAAGKILHCGSGLYACAVVASMKPFILISMEGDMMWTVDWSPADLQIVGRANDRVLGNVEARLLREGIIKEEPVQITGERFIDIGESRGQGC